jgi:hypothetical protein
MRTSARPIPPLRELIDTELPALELERLVRVDALLREARPYLRPVTANDLRMRQSGYSSFRQARGSAGCPFGAARSSRKV